MVLVQIIAQEFGLARERGAAAGREAPGHIGEIDPANHELERCRKSRLIELSITGQIAIARFDGAAVFDQAVGPEAIHVGVKAVARPGAAMIGCVAVRDDIARVWHRHMSKQEESFDVFRIGVVEGFDSAFDGRDGFGSADVQARHLPAISGEILLQAGQFTGERLGLRVVNDEEQTSAVFGRGDLDSGAEIAVAGVLGGGFDNLIFVNCAGLNVGIDIFGGGSGNGDSLAPGAGIGSFAIDCVCLRRGAGILRPM